jgi:hypothetical protein
VPAVEAWAIEPLWVQFEALLPPHLETHPWGCHNPGIPDRIVFDKLVAKLVFGGSYEKHADQSCSATTMRTRRNEWIAAGVFAGLEQIVLERGLLWSAGVGVFVVLPRARPSAGPGELAGAKMPGHTRHRLIRLFPDQPRYGLNAHSPALIDFSVMRTCESRRCRSQYAPACQWPHGVVSTWGRLPDFTLWLRCSPAEGGSGSRKARWSAQAGPVRYSWLSTFL